MGGHLHTAYPCTICAYPLEGEAARDFLYGRSKADGIATLVQKPPIILPDWFDLSEKFDKGEPLTPMEQFLYDWEPAGHESDKFRESLLKIITGI